MKFLREVDERGRAALDTWCAAAGAGRRIRAAEVFAVEVGRISAAVSYYGNYRDEIAAEVTEADDASERAEVAWRVQQDLIA